MDPWDFSSMFGGGDAPGGFGGLGAPGSDGSGFMVPPTNLPGAGMPVVPPTDLASVVAGHLASQGVRPDQFFQNPQAFAGGKVAPQPGDPGNATLWDPTPVPGPSGGPTLAPAQPDALTSAQDGGKGADANASGSAADKAGGKKPGDNVLAALKGLQAPPVPKPQQIRSPQAPEPGKQAIKTGELIALLSAMQPGVQKPNPLQGMSLGAILGGRG